MSPEQRIEALEDRVALLEEALGLTYQAPDRFGLTPTERRLVGLLLKSERVANARLYAALYAHTNDAPGENNIKVRICTARKKLAKFGVEIHNDWGFGYWIPAEQKARLADA